MLEKHFALVIQAGDGLYDYNLPYSIRLMVFI